MFIFVLALMLSVQPAAPWLPSYVDTAHEIAAAAEANPLFEGSDGAQRTAALLVSLAWFESSFRPDAVGDGGRSRGLFQVATNWGPPDAAKALALIRESFKVCAARPLDERLGWYAAGGSGCSRGLPQSRHRMALARKLLAP